MATSPRVSARDATCLLTGATSGIGEAVATSLVARGATVLAVARDSERGNAAVTRIRRRVPDARIELLVADLSIMGSVRSLAGQVMARGDRLNVLILNAGVARPRRELTPEGFEVDFATNHLSPFLLTALLLDLLCASAPSRIVTTSSSTHRRVKHIDFDDLASGRNFHHLRSYSTTKLLTILFTAELARRLDASGVTANTADPGFVRTALGRDAPGTFALFLKATRAFQLTPEQAAATTVHLATSSDLAAASGGYYTKCRAAEPSSLASDQAAASRLWALSADLVAPFMER